jgi:hypothetical protein
MLFIVMTVILSLAVGILCFIFDAGLITSIIMTICVFLTIQGLRESISLMLYRIKKTPVKTLG